MKEKCFQIISLALNVILLIALFATRAELADTQTILKSNLDGIAWRLSDMDDRLTNLSAKQREQTENLSDFSLEPTGLDPESHTLQTNMNITLRRWTEDTAVTLLVIRNGETAELPMTGIDGVFTVPVNLSLESMGEASFAVNITVSGQTSREEVASYRDIAMLLPLVSDSNSCGGPTYQEGVFQIQYDMGIKKQYGAEISEPAFQVLKNGEAVRTLPAVISESASSGDPDVIYYTPASDDGNIEVSCQPKDTIELHLLCRDSFGLSYDFTAYSCESEESGEIREILSATDCDVEVSWE